MSSTGLPSGVIERVFSELVGLYGASFTRQWSNVEPEAMKRTWSRELAGYTRDEIARGLAGCRAKEFPPTLPEFLRLCRPAIDAEEAFAEAARLWPSRVGYSDAAIYWAALSIGNDVARLPYAAIRGRWKEAYRRAVDQHRPLPPPLEPPRLEFEPSTPEQLQAVQNKVFGWCAKVWPDWAHRRGR